MSDGEGPGGSDADRTRVDMHVKALSDSVVDRAAARGIDVLVYAPHFTRLPEIKAEADAYSDSEVTVVPARELFTGDWANRRHLLAIGLDDPIPDFITFEAALAECERQGASVVVPHPGFANVSLTEAEIRANADRLDAVETYCAKLFGYQNRRGQRVADELPIPGFGSSYSHLARTVGEAWTTFDREIDSTEGLVDALQTRAPRETMHRSDLTHRSHQLLEYVHLGYENSWKKIDRLLLSGDEPTHPRNVIYEGRFDDVRVY